MKNPRRGFVNIELMILIALTGIGAALVIPPVTKLIRHQPMSNGAWVGLGFGGLLTLLGAGTWVKWQISEWLERRRKP